MHFWTQFFIAAAAWAVVVGGVGYWKYWPTMEEMRASKVAWANDLARDMLVHRVAPDRAAAIAVPCNSCDLVIWAKEVRERLAATESRPGAPPDGLGPKEQRRYYTAMVSAYRELDGVPKDVEQLKKTQDANARALIEIWAYSIPVLLFIGIIVARAYTLIREAIRKDG